MLEHHEYQGDGSANDIATVQAGTIKKGSYCIIKGFPCQIIAVSVKIVNGKPKVFIEGTDLFTNKTYEQTLPASGIVNVPSIKVSEYEVADIDEEEFVSLVMDDGSLKSSLKVPKEEALYAELIKLWSSKQDGEQVRYSVFKAYGQEKIVGGRIVKPVQ